MADYKPLAVVHPSKKGILGQRIALRGGATESRPARPHFADVDEWFIAHSRLGVSSESAATINFVN